jgi:hypothetical protein
MSSTRRYALAAAACLITLLVVGATVAALRDRGEDQPSLGGAELIAGDGDRPHPVRRRDLADLKFDDSDYRAKDVRADADGHLLVLTGSRACFDAQLETAGCSGNVIRYDNDFRLDAWTSAVSPPAGHLAVGPDGAIIQFAGSGTSLWPALEKSDVPEPVEGLPVSAYSGSYTNDGTLVLADRTEPWIVSLAADDTVTNLLTPEGSEPAPLHLDSPKSRLTVVALPDDRVAFAVNSPDDPEHDGQLYLIASIVAGDGGAEGDGAGSPTMTLVETTTDNPIRRIFPGPDGTLLALDGPSISQVDPDTGDTTSLIDLSELTDELGPADVSWPPKDEVSATALGDDLIFTADAKIWRLPDAFA